MSKPSNAARRDFDEYTIKENIGKLAKLSSQFIRQNFLEHSPKVRSALESIDNLFQNIRYQEYKPDVNSPMGLILRESDHDNDQVCTVISQDGAVHRMPYFMLKDCIEEEKIMTLDDVNAKSKNRSNVDTSEVYHNLLVAIQVAELALNMPVREEPEHTYNQTALHKSEIKDEMAM